MQISPLQKDIILSLHAAHVAGLTEVPLANLASELCLTLHELRCEVRALISAGICDRMDGEDVASLSAAGLRSARTLSQPTNFQHTDSRPSESQHTRSSEEPTYSAGAEHFLNLLRKASEQWSAVIGASNRGNEEKSRLASLGSELFSHPAFFEFIRRSLLLAHSNSMNERER